MCAAFLIFMVVITISAIRTDNKASNEREVQQLASRYVAAFTAVPGHASLNFSTWKTQYMEVEAASRRLSFLQSSAASGAIADGKAADMIIAAQNEYASINAGYRATYFSA